jgi:hypothetical protein
LREGDQQRVAGNPLPAPVCDWIEGKITLQTLTEEARCRFRGIAHVVLEMMKCFDVLTADDVREELLRIEGDSGDRRRREPPLWERERKRRIEEGVRDLLRLPQYLLDRARALAQSKGMNIEQVLNEALSAGLKLLEGGRTTDPLPTPLARSELNDPRTWQDLSAWAKRELRLSPDQEAIVAQMASDLMNGNRIYDRRKAERVFDKAVRCGYKPPSANVFSG